MQDRVPLYPGRVKLTPVAGQENVYDMVRADQPTQEGTPLNKNSLLKDATAALFQLSGDTALPDKVFELLSRFNNGLGNEYLWSKFGVSYEITFESKGNELVYQKVYNNTVTYYSSISLVGDEIVLSDQHTVKLTSVSEANKLVGNYVMNDYGIYTGKVTKISEAERASSNFNFKGSIANVSKKEGAITYVNSPDPDAYPPAEPDGYEYSGPKKLGDFPFMASGSYIGTGTTGENGASSISVDFKPSIVIIGRNYSDGKFPGQMTYIMISPAFSATENYMETGMAINNRNAYLFNQRYKDGVYSWYKRDQGLQFNYSGIGYSYLILGG